MADGCENVATVSGSPLNIHDGTDVEEIGFFFPVVKRQVVVELIVIHRQIPAQKGGMGGENRFQVKPVVTDSWDWKACHPLVEVNEILPVAAAHLAINPEKLFHLVTE